MKPQPTDRRIEKPRLVFRVGISGHRPNGLDAAVADEIVLREQVRVALQLVADTVRSVQQDGAAPYAPGEPILRLITPLAEGADRLCAQVALDLGFELDVLQPFARDAYERDFVSKGDDPPRDTRPEFQALLRKARRVLELDSAPKHDTAYVAVGTTTVRQCDLLLAIWDGKVAQGPGGVAENVAEALRIDLPTLWIDAHRATKHEMGLASMQDGKIVRQQWGPDEVAARVRVLISLPASQRHARDTHRQPTSALTCAQDFFAEQPKRSLPGSLFATANAYFARGWQQDAEYRELCERFDVDSPVSNQDRAQVGSDDGALAHELGDDVPASEWTPEFPPLLKALGASLAPAFLDADRLAIRYAHLHRDYLPRVFLPYAPLAVLCAFGGFALRDYVAVTIMFGLAVVALIGVVWWRHRQNLQGRYHEKWLDYRSIAERLRHILILAPLGRPSLGMQLPISLGASDLNHWTNWYLRARIREEGLVSGRLHDREYTAALHTLLWRWLVRGQIRFHARTAARMRTALRRVHAWRDGFFVAAAVVAAGNVAIAALDIACPEIHVWEREHEWLALALVAATVLFPAVATALHGYSLQADFENTETRSRSELERLLQVDRDLRARQEPSRLDLIRATTLTSESMLAELAE